MQRVEQGTALVDKAGETMIEVVTSIRRVTDIMGEISVASDEQASGVAQVGEAVIQMDQATQQNAALVEQMAAAASSLKTRANELVQTVAVFKLDANDKVVRTTARASVSQSAPFKGGERRATLTVKVASDLKPKLVTSKPASLQKTYLQADAKPAAKDEEWETF